ncbi:PDGLE domain-containing protein [Thermovenabulum sp.]|uniref:PDGLE domain-containing protein n=1 Tax=Thermovenabulum sp. TaxID=3100335 RepID=UPI003C7E4DC8
MKIIKKVWVYILFAALVIAALLSPFASSLPDGLERVSSNLNFEEKAVQGLIPSPFSEYRVSFIQNDYISTAFAGTLGTLAVFALSYAIGRMILIQIKK